MILGRIIETTINIRLRIYIFSLTMMMLFDNIEKVSHAMEDIFYFIREQKPADLDFSAVSDLVLECVDFIKAEINKITNRNDPDGNPSGLIQSLKVFLDELRQIFGKEDRQSRYQQKKQQYYIPQEKNQDLPSDDNPTDKESGAGSEGSCYQVIIQYEDDCMMENIRAYTLVFGLAGLCPGDLQSARPDYSVNGFAVAVSKKIHCLR
ncbi:MAG: hypothetical protein PHO29_09585 [Acetobacterium sp.]|nr:hypothetical protein [Acetobacterium sp.]